MFLQNLGIGTQVLLQIDIGREHATVCPRHLSR